MASVQLFRRKAIATVGTVELKDLHFQFTVKKSLKPEPNTCDLTVFNLNRTHRAELEQLDKVTVKLEAGYEGGTSVIFLGTLRHIDSGLRDGPDILTHVSSGDGEQQYRKSRVAIAIKKDTTTDAVLKQLAAAIGVGTGNLDKAVSTLKAVGLSNMFSEGTVLYGSASREMTAICRSVGFLWSIQNGALQLVAIGKALDGEAIKLTPETGLIGSPSTDNKGIVKLRALMIPDIFPGRKIVVDSFSLDGQFRIETTTHSGDTSGSDWYIDIEAKRY